MAPVRMAAGQDDFINGLWADANGQEREPENPPAARRLLAIAVLLAVLGITVAVRGFEPGAEERYLTLLRDQGLAGQFSSDANAVAAGRKVCRNLDDGGTQQGKPAAKAAVDAFCSRFAKGFKVLETITVDSSITIYDSSWYSSGLTSSGNRCSGSGGYSDIHAGTQVTIKNGSGTVLAYSELQPGVGGSSICKFPFKFEVTEGESMYIVSVGRRGDVSFSFTDLKLDGARLSLG